MVFLTLYFVFLFIAPQLWIPPFIGMRTDVLLYPAWFLWILMAGRGRAFFKFGPQDWFFAGFVTWMTLSLGANGFGDSFELIVFTYVKWLFLYRLVATTLPTLAHVKIGLIILLAFGLILALQGVHQAQDIYGAGWANQGYAWMDDATADAGYSGRTRWVNIFDGPGVYCVVFTMTLPLALQYVWRPFGVLTMIVGAGLTALLLLATYYTGSRGGFLATVGVLGFFMLVKLRISVPKMIAVGLIGLAAFVFGPEHLTSTRDSNRSAQRRVAMWGEGVEMIEQNPLFGIGRGNFARYTGRLIAHNSAIEIMGETGVPGTITWLGLIYMAYKNILAVRRQLDNDRVMRSYVDAVGLAIAGYLLSAMFVTLEYETFYVLLAFASACGASLKEPPRFTKRDFYILGGTILTFFIIIKVFVMVYFA